MPEKKKKLSVDSDSDNVVTKKKKKVDKLESSGKPEIQFFCFINID